MPVICEKEEKRRRYCHGTNTATEKRFVNLVHVRVICPNSARIHVRWLRQ
jgi:hypothetical protein